MAENLVFLAGRQAIKRIRDKGLSPDMVKVIAGAAGGPKWLILAGLDRMIFSQWLGKRTDPVFLVGSSIGAWRFAAAAQHDPAGAVARFQEAYIAQTYDSEPSPGDVTRESIKVMDRYLGETGVRDILDHPYLRLNVLTVRSAPLVSNDRKLPLTLGFTGVVLANMIHRPFLRFFFERGLFYDPRQKPPFWGMNDFPVQKIPLNGKNMKSAILASGSIPMVMSGVTDIPGAPKGVYRDAGVIDYHPDIPFMKDEDRIVLFPHYTGRLIPGWLDKRLKWRKPLAGNMKNVLMISPSPEFVKRLPLGKISDRTDFYRFRGRDAERMQYWRDVALAGEQLAEEFAEAVDTGSIKKRVRPLPCRD